MLGKFLVSYEQDSSFPDPWSVVKHETKCSRCRPRHMLCTVLQNFILTGPSCQKGIRIGDSQAGMSQHGLTSVP